MNSAILYFFETSAQVSVLEKTKKLIINQKDRKIEYIYIYIYIYI